MKTLTSKKIQQIASPFLNATEQNMGFIGSKEALKDLKEARRILKMINNNIDDYVKELVKKTDLNMSDILPRLIRDLPEIIRQYKAKEQRAIKNILSNARLIKMNLKEAQNV